MNAHVARLLLEGQYICSFRYPDEFGALEDVAEQEAVSAWLGGMNMRLARLGETGAFFMAPEVMGAREINLIKKELQDFRDVYGPVVQLLDFIRQTDAVNVTLSPGELIALYSLEQAVGQSSTLEMQLKSRLAFIPHVSARNTNREILRRMLDKLVSEGFAVLFNKDTETYRITGKIDQLYTVLQFISENKLVGDSEVDDSSVTEADLLEQMDIPEEPV